MAFQNASGDYAEKDGGRQQVADHLADIFEQEFMSRLHVEDEEDLDIISILDIAIRTINR